MEYGKELTKAMEWLGKKKDTIFLGQTVEYLGSPSYNSLKKVPKNKKIEMPVFENTQMGISIGLALNGYIPISVFPRMDFLICAVDQLVNHLDKIKEMSKGEFTPGVIIKTQIGATAPLDPGIQHKGDYRKGLSKMLKNIYLRTIEDTSEVVDVYKTAYKNAKKGISSIIVELPQKPNIKNFHEVKK